MQETHHTSPDIPRLVVPLLALAAHMFQPYPQVHPWVCQPDHLWGYHRARVELAALRREEQPAAC
jgi:hypothetical protein